MSSVAHTTEAKNFISRFFHIEREFSASRSWRPPRTDQRKIPAISNQVPDYPNSRVPDVLLVGGCRCSPPKMDYWKPGTWAASKLRRRRARPPLSQCHTGAARWQALWQALKIPRLRAKRDQHLHVDDLRLVLVDDGDDDRQRWKEPWRPTTLRNRHQQPKLHISILAVSSISPITGKAKWKLMENGIFLCHDGWRHFTVFPHQLVRSGCPRSPGLRFKIDPMRHHLDNSRICAGQGHGLLDSSCPASSALPQSAGRADRPFDHTRSNDSPSKRLAEKRDRPSYKRLGKASGPWHSSVLSR